MAEETFIRKKSKKGEEDEGGLDPDAWMVTFSDLLQLLITFFVLLISSASMDNQVVKEMFSVFGGGMGELNSTNRSRLANPSIVPSVIPQTVTIESLIALLRFDPSQTRLKETLVELVNSVMVEQVEFVKRGKEFSMLLPDDALFEPGQVEIKDSLKPALDKIGEVLALSENQIKIEGHSDDIPTAGRYLHSNWELSAARATSVLKYFLEKGVISPDRIEARGYASYHPKAPNIGNFYRKRNRRVEIVIKQFEKESF